MLKTAISCYPTTVILAHKLTNLANDKRPIHFYFQGLDTQRQHR